MVDNIGTNSMVEEGELTLEGRLLTASNATFYCGLALDGAAGHAVYKPVRGERPLWDFPDGSLARREVAAYRLSVASGWDLIPPTVLRDGPLGEGMVQLWVDPDEDSSVVDVVPRGAVPSGWRRVFDAFDPEGNDVSLVHANDPVLRRMALFDVIANNADRKGGHLLTAVSDDRLYGVDHGLCFHVDDKLRTVLWGWSGEPLTDEELADLARLESDPPDLTGLLDAGEIEALHARIGKLRTSGVFPAPGEGWPSIPWPVF